MNPVVGIGLIGHLTGRTLAGILAVFAEFEREILRERVKAGIAQARAKGGFPSGLDPYLFRCAARNLPSPHDGGDHAA